MEKFAPVLIPTLNRHIHFKRCVDSLSKCTHAEKTDLYIALDYPLNESHWDGYKKTKEYLSQVKGFKTIHIFERKQNYGTSKNVRDARRIILGKHDRIICSEDDNIFSPNFLEYINKGLEKYKNDKTVLAIAGYCHFYNIRFAENNFFRQNVDFSAWGYGIWKDRLDEIQKKSTRNFYWKAAFNPRVALRVWRNGSNRFSHLILCSRKKWDKRNNDRTLSVYMAINKQYVIVPVISKVRNIGWDGSGLHCDGDKFKRYHLSLRKIHEKQAIDKSSNFDFKGRDWLFVKENRTVFVKESYGRIPLYKGLMFLIYRYVFFWE